MRFRRRPPRWRRPIGFRPRPIRRALLQKLRKAHRSFDSGRWEDAAVHFENIALALERRRLPQAPQMFVRAGRARLALGDHTSGVAHLAHAITLFAQYSQHQRLHQIRPRLLQSLRDLGLEREAIELDQRLHTVLDQQPAEVSGPPPRSHIKFPPKCFSCGGTLRQDEMEIIEGRAGVCVYCGSIIHAE